ncbi:MAG TPA: dTDP-4-dehydrorhamnose reductase [Candidatus Angelobacter sp.]
MGTILLTGATGQVGWELQQSLAVLGNVIAYDHQRFDLSNKDQICDTIRTVRPNVIVNAAAYTAVDRAESEPELVMQINATAPGIMAEEAKRIGAIMVHYSTDYVFDGRKREPYMEDDEPNPLNVYGKSKLAGETAIRAAAGSFLIFRTSWLYGTRGQNFLLTILRLARSRNELRIVDDQYGAPTWSRTIADATANVLHQMISKREREISRIFHLSAMGATTWCRFAKRALDQLKLATRVIPISTAEYPTPAMRPSNSMLATEELSKSFEIKLPRWETALDQVLRELKALENTNLVES